MEEEAVDLIAYLKEAAVILGIECTISHPQTLGKMPKLVTRCRRMEETVKDLGLEVIPVLATALDEVSQSEIETAAHDGISLLTQKDLLKLLQLAGAGAQPTAILRHIRSRITNKDAGPFGAQFG
ncbi:MAG: hypothetical protein M0D55_15110 [Elusimicrobiota bacterium]|nr:MAG: hypothetical protein M0D55_15110 [Elusimicrobiota bacterium]